MYLDMQCSCGAAFTVQDAADELTMLYADRFASAHQNCGFMTNLRRDEDEETTRYNYRKREKEAE